MAKQSASKTSKASSNLATPAQTLPMDIFKKSPQDGAIAMGGSSSPYVQFFHDRSKNAQQVIQALGSMRQGDPFLVRGGTFTKLTPLSFIMTETYYQYYAQVDMESKITKAILPDPDGGMAPQGFVEFIEALVFTIVSSKDIVCARMRLRGPKCKGFKQAITALEHMRSNQDWAKETKENGLAVQSKLPDWAYLTHTATLTTTPPKGKGLPYEIMTTDCRTTQATVLHTLASGLMDTEYQNGCKAAQQELLARWDNEILPKSK
jgi:hypothetical protein